MTGRTLAAALVDRGLDPVELPAKRALFDLVLGAFGELPEIGVGKADAPREPRHVWWVPGRLEVFGKHTDYAGGRTLVCAVPRGLIVAARPRRDGKVHVVDARRAESVTVLPLEHDAGSDHNVGRNAGLGLEPPPLRTPPPRTPPQQFTGWRHYVAVVARRLARNFPGAHVGADVVIASDLPRAAGMSSSSTLIVGLASALVRVAGIDARPEWQANIRGSLDTAGYYACIENGMTFGTLEGDAGVGTHGGSEDHAAILTGAPGALSAFAFVPMRHIGNVHVPDRWRFVVSPCGVRAAKTGAAQGSYNRLARGTQVLLQLWNSAEPKAMSVGSALASRGTTAGAVNGDAPGQRAAQGFNPVSTVERLRELIRRSDIPGWPAAALEKRLDHFIREDARVPAALEAFRDADGARLTALSEQSQADAETLLENQVAETSALARSARELGAFGACSFGAGFGGSVWALVERDGAPELAQRWHPDAFVAVPGPSLTELDGVR